MPRLVRTARGVQLDFDTIIIKQQLAQAPMNIEVARRKEFIDSKEGKARGSKQPEASTEVIEEESTATVQVEAVNAPAPVEAPAATSKKKTK